MPDCGPFLISKGIAFETQVQDISAEESIKLFNLCRSCEGFQNFRSVEAAFEQDIKNPNNLD